MIHIIPILRDNYCYLLEGDNKQCLILDPGQVTPVQAYIEQHGFRPTAILNTHHHADHIAGNAELKATYSIPVIGPQAEEKSIPNMNKGLKDGDVYSQSGIEIGVIGTPGHTNGHISFYWKDKKSLFAGDTLFSMGCGRLIEGTAADMYASLQKLKSLHGETLLYCGHEYTQSNGEFALSVEPDNEDIKIRMKDVGKLRGNNLPTLPVSLEIELKTNPFLRAKSQNDFAGLRARKDTF